MATSLAHIFESSTAISTWWLIAGGLTVMLLMLEHHLVAGTQFRVVGRNAMAVSMVAALAVLGMPAVGAQSDDMLLPDLVSDPPNPSFFNELNTTDGKTRLVVTFDGYVHNIGAGPLDIVGNPQEAAGMEQRVRDGDDWLSVGTPTVRFETDDGHNHFHLIEAIEYVLVDELQTTQTAIGSKVGFCLVDSELMEPGLAQAYSEEGDKFCEEGNPGATSLRMGITPGWRDIYDATTTLQWVDVSNVAPGRYWIGAITDPNNEILESNEDNNDLVFSPRTIAVPGYSPRPMAVLQVGSEPQEISLAATAHGTVGRPLYVIDEAPSFGTINVPIAIPLDNPNFVYTPNAGFVGQDSFTFSVSDGSSPYPIDRPSQLVELQVDASAADVSGEPRDGVAPPSITASSTFFESTVGERFDVAVDVIAGDGGPAALHASSLPPGLVADSTTGVIRGVPIQDGIFDVVLTASAHGLTTPLPVAWIVNQVSAPAGLVDIADRSSPRGEPTRLRVGSNTLGDQFEASGLPPGLTTDPSAPVISGRATETGVYEVEVRQLTGDDVVAETSFTWTIRPAADIAFVL